MVIDPYVLEASTTYGSVSGVVSLKKEQVSQFQSFRPNFTLNILSILFEFIFTVSNDGSVSWEYCQHICRRASVVTASLLHASARNLKFCSLNTGGAHHILGHVLS